MKTLYKTAKLLTVGGYRACIEVMSDGKQLHFSITHKNNSKTAYSGTVAIDVTYNGESRALEWKTAGSASAVFDYSDSVKSVVVSGAEINYKNVSYGTSHVFTWAGSYSTPDPTLNLTCPLVFVYNKTSDLTWKVSDPLGREYRVLGVNLVGKYSPDENFMTVIQSSYTSSSYSYTPGPYTQFTIGHYVFLEVMIGVFGSSDDDDESYVGFAEAKTPIYYINQNALSAAPYFVSISELKKGETCTVKWKDVNDDSPYSIKSYELMCGVNGGTVDTTLYSGSGTSYTYTIGEDVKTVKFAVRSISHYSSKHSEYNITEWKRVAGGVNIYIGVGGEVKEAVGAYLGRGGDLIEIGEVTVG
ncbi:MAG: hypothetical protein E7672_01245 [Ruminococcaceae bacterium]|nr:hypothetical protein [Oscillospiraceae bacterium]